MRSGARFAIHSGGFLPALALHVRRRGRERHERARPARGPFARYDVRSPPRRPEETTTSRKRPRRARWLRFEERRWSWRLPFLYAARRAAETPPLSQYVDWYGERTRSGAVTFPRVANRQD